MCTTFVKKKKKDFISTDPFAEARSNKYSQYSPISLVAVFLDAVYRAVHFFVLLHCKAVRTSNFTYFNTQIFLGKGLQQL